MSCLDCGKYYHLSGACCTIPPVNRCTDKESPKYGDLKDFDGCKLFELPTPKPKKERRIRCLK